MIFFCTSLLQAIEVDSDNIDQKHYFIKIGTFAKLYNIKKIQEKLSHYPIYLHPYKNLQRVYVVNVSKEEIQTTLLAIRKLYPDAYIAKKPALSKPKVEMPVEPIMQSKKETKPVQESVEKEVKIKEKIDQPATVEDIGHLFESVHKKSEKIESDLNSESIIKTRKSFL
ncbi:MAG: hypothetical protein K0U47_04275 [Epsilonproteobacteria bacterium]|nr:hypothetical protein [Campylobacterota bacterium]